MKLLLITQMGCCILLLSYTENQVYFKPANRMRIWEGKSNVSFTVLDGNLQIMEKPKKVAFKS